MKVNRALLLFGAVGLQIASWFDVSFLSERIFHTRPNALQVAQAVGSGVLYIVWASIKKDKTCA